ncbi:MAG: primosomal protein N' [Chloroflexota bacterium]|nr:primosomal protein N' [Chloroflexota bacterium]
MADSLYAVVAVDMSSRQKIGMLARMAAEAKELEGRVEEHPLLRAYHYAVPRELLEQLVPGQLLWVPFGSEQRQGVLLGFDDRAPVPHVRPIQAIAQAEPFLQPYGIDLARWMSERYLAPLWDTLLLMLPPGVLQSTERVLRRTREEVIRPLSSDARRVLAWIESQQGESTLQLVTEVLGSEKRARHAVSDLLQAGLLRDETIAKPPGVRPRTERFVSLVGDPRFRQECFRTLGRSSKQADVIERLIEQGGEMALKALLTSTETDERIIARLVEKGMVEWVPGTFVQRVWPEGAVDLSEAQEEALAWVDSWPNDEPLPVRLMREAGVMAATIRGLEARGCLRVIEREPERVRLLLPTYRVNTVLDELRRSESYRRVVDFLQRQPMEVTVGEIYEATGAKWYHLETLAERGIVRIDYREVLRNPLAERIFKPTEPPPFTPEQSAVWAELERVLIRERDAVQAGGVFLLHGITGSGKTEIYLRAVAETLARGKQAIVLVPEIALTPQTIARFGSRFGELIALQHSQLSEGERYDEWRRLRDGQAHIVIGSRSAIFAPVPNLGLIVVDEEHEWTYKQGHLPGYRFPQYHVRDVAERLAELTGAMVILGSATPALESYYRAEQGRYRLLEMGQRVTAQLAGERSSGSGERRAGSGTARGSGSGEREVGDGRQSTTGLSPVQVVDMRQELRVGNTSIFSRDLQGAIQIALAARQQVILFLNRRGTHSFVMCRDCGWVQQCAQCDVPMSSHRGLPYLICHQCNAAQPIPQYCPSCLSPRVKHFGIGTQQVEDVAQRQFPEARILRWDRDTAWQKGAHERLLTRFAAGQADILVGTQMIAKGLDLPLVTLVGVISADTALHLPDFRSGERTFQLLTQVAGRAGRSALGGKVILQTYTPLHYAIQSASRHNFHEFYRQELAFRREHAYPPFVPLVKLVYSDPSPRAAEERAKEMAERLGTRCVQLGFPGTDVLGPAPSFFSRLRGKYRWQILVRGVHARALVREVPAGIGWEVDVDPASVL